VDGVGTLVRLAPVSAGVEASDWVLRVRLPESLPRYVVEKGSIAVEGISLTVAGIEGDEVWIAILPHTYSATNLHTLTPGMALNIEVDVMAKYAESRERAEAGMHELTVEYLLANGY
jgi:riboflavin synthase